MPVLDDELAVERRALGGRTRSTAELGADGLVGECERVLARHDALARCASIEPRRREDQQADLRLLFSDRAWLGSPAGRAMLADFEEHPALVSAQRHKAAILLRFNDAILGTLERRLAAGEIAGMGTARLLAGARFTVSIVGPNTNKALHVGHLRNIVVGQALACAMDAAGAHVTRHNLVGDIGRRVCEALAGYMSAHDGEDPDSLGLAPDRFVELCCRDFANEFTPASAAADDPNAEEAHARGDLADAVMQAWMRGSSQEQALWRRMRGWALDGHTATLARLGLHMDRQDFESDGIARARELIAGGLAQGVFEREPSGAVVYRTGRPEYATMVLLRADGAPTEYARLLGVYHRMHAELAPDDALYVEVVGIEWRPVMEVQAELLTHFLPTPSERHYTWAFHGSLTVGGQKMGSSTGAVKWIDDLLDEVAAGPAVARLHELAGGGVSREELADVLVRGSFLCSATLEPLSFMYERLLTGEAGPGWTIAQAWCLAQQACTSAAVGPVARTAVVQSQLFRRTLRRAVDRHDAASLSSYLLGLCEACLAAPARGPAARAMLGRVLHSLGFRVGASGAREGGG